MKKPNKLNTTLIEKIPNKTINILFLFAILFWLGVFCGIMLIEKPDVIRGRLKIVTNEQPSSIIACNTGSLIFCEQTDSIVKKGNLLAYIENSADLQTVLDLESALNTYSDSTLYDYFLMLDHNKLGDLSYSYLTVKDFILKLQLYQKSELNKIERNKTEKNITFIQRNISEKQEALKSLGHRLVIAKEQMDTDSILYEKGAILKNEYNNSKNNFLAIQSQNFQLQIEITNLLQQQNDLSHNLNYSIVSDIESIEKLKMNISNQINILLSDIEKWKGNYLMYATTDGQLEKVNFAEDYQTVNKGTEILKILPKFNLVRALLYYSGQGAGKVNKNFVVKIYLDDFKKNEDGYLLGKIEHLSSSSYIDQNTIGHYAATIEIDMSNQIHFKSDFRFAHNMTGEAEIIVKGKTLFFEIFAWLQNLINEN
jgi:hypothetical protein